MKTRFSLYLLLLSFVSLMFVACGEDQELPKDPEDPEVPVVPDEPGKHNGHAYVDLGLPSGLLWAECNVGATLPEEYGTYFAWGETEEKDIFMWATYKHGSSEAVQTKYCKDDDKGRLDPADDAAYRNWGGKWRMPLNDEIDELLSNCTTEITTVSGIKGYKFVSKINGNSIFLPAAGYADGEKKCYAGEVGYFWSADVDTDYWYVAWDLGINLEDDVVRRRQDIRCYGQSVRPVYNPK